QEELNAIHAAGLSRVHVGLESGSDEVLKFMEKGVTAQELIDSGRKTIEAGIELSEYVMPGLGGRKWSNVHALETARVLNEIGRPDFIRLRTLKIRKGTPLWDKYIQGEFALLTEDEMVDEMELMIQNLTCTSYLVSDHVDNLLFEVEGKLPQDKKKILDAIAKYKAMPVKDKLTFKLSKYTSHYYDYDHTDTKLDRSIREAWDSIEKNSPDAEEKVEKAIAAIFNYPYFQT
ncbi:MAG: radical SAM protein, partial [Chloroflexi bacterium]|nr:radical SAM protein [Chloroflexota bacterium]